MDEIDIWRSAKLLMDEYGDGAELEAAKRAGSFVEAGDIEGGAVWVRIAHTILRIRDTTPPTALN
jgi:hypothetical protein